MPMFVAILRRLCDDYIFIVTILRTRTTDTKLALILAVENRQGATKALLAYGTTKFAVEHHLISAIAGSNSLIVREFVVYGYLSPNDFSMLCTEDTSLDVLLYITVNGVRLTIGLLERVERLVIRSDLRSIGSIYRITLRIL